MSIKLKSIFESIISEQDPTLPDISLESVYQNIGSCLSELRQLASAQGNDPELIKIHAQFEALRARLKPLLAKSQGQ